MDTLRFNNNKMIVIDGCEHCILGTAEYQCLDCKDDNVESKMCSDCKKEHIEGALANPNRIVKLPIEGKVYE